MSTETRDEIAEQLAAEAGPEMADLYEVDEATRRLFVERADRVRGFIAAELRRIATERIVQEPRAGQLKDWDRGWNAARQTLLARADELPA